MKRLWSHLNAVARLSWYLNVVARLSSYLNVVARLTAHLNVVAGLAAHLNAVAGLASRLNAVAPWTAHRSAVAGLAAHLNAIAGLTSRLNAVAPWTRHRSAVAGLTALCLAGMAVSAQQALPEGPGPGGAAAGVPGAGVPGAGGAGPAGGVGKPPPGYGDQYAGRKKVLIIGDTHTGNQNAHDSVSHAMATLERLGRESGAYIAFIRTDTEWVTKDEVWGTGDYAKGGSKQARGHNLSYFDALIFYTNGDTDMTDSQKNDLLSFVHDDGKGFVAVHTATSTLLKWPEYGEMVGGYFDDHPWNIVAAPVILERADFPGLRFLPKDPVFTDEMYQYKAPYSRDKVDVLLRLDTSKLEMNKRVHRTDGDFPVAWIKNYGKGRVFSSTLGHSDQSWDDPRVQTLYLEGVKWVLGLTEFPVSPHPLPH